MGRVGERIGGLADAVVTALLRAVIVGYRHSLSPLIGGSCRYWPSCSTYALEAVDRYGGLTGGRLALGRLLRCHPWGGSGIDPVPDLHHGPACAHRRAGRLC